MFLSKASTEMTHEVHEMLLGTEEHALQFWLIHVSKSSLPCVVPFLHMGWKGPPRP